MTRHEFLAALHELLRPKVYLEVGVQHGTSLALAVHSERAIGVDPEPSLLLQHERHGQEVYAVTSDAFFAEHFEVIPEQVDLAFIDGSHLAEDALRDFINIEQYCGPKSVVVFDDMLPYSQAIAERVQPPGDWTGDVWKVFYAIQEEYDECLEYRLVDTFPTGTLMVWGFHEHNGQPEIGDYSSDEVPSEIINRTRASQPQAVLESLATYLDLIKENVCASPSPGEPASLDGPPVSGLIP